MNEFRKDLLKKHRTHKRLSQTAFGAMVGMNQRQISRYESGKNVPTANNLAKLAAPFGGNVAIFFSDSITA